MNFVLHYGADSTAEIDLADGALVAECGVPSRLAVEDLESAVVTALANPLEYPPLDQAAVPGDHVVLALEAALPRAAEIVSAVVQVLLHGDIEPEDIVVLRTMADVETRADNPCRLLPETLQDRIQFLTHDPADSNHMAYLAATEGGQPVVLNRVIVDADVVLPVGCEQSRTALEHYGVYSPVFPAFSDHETQLRYRRHRHLIPKGREQRRLAEEVGEVGWLLGAAFAIQVVPGSGDQVLDVLAGDVQSVGRRGRELYDAAWSWSVSRRASLVVAAIQGGPVQQTWHHLGRALAAALPLVEEDGAIAVCSNLAVQPGPAVQILGAARSREEALGRIGAERPADALPAVQLSHALERTRVYLLSDLAPSLVEDLQMIPIARPRELARLAGQHESCILLSNAPHAVVTVQSPEG
jgi:nickel-dependent lactate racemase